MSKIGTPLICMMMVFFTLIAFQAVADTWFRVGYFGPLRASSAFFFHGTINCDPEILSLVSNGQLVAYHCSEVIIIS